MDKQIADRTILDYRDRIFGFALHKTFNTDQAEELASEIILEVYSTLLKRDQIANLDGYVYRIASNVWARYAACLSRNRRIENLDDRYQYGQYYLDEYPSCEVPSNEEEMLRKEIHYLSDRQRMIIYLYYYEHRKTAEIAEKIGLSEGTVKWHLSDARTRLKEGLEMHMTDEMTELNPIRFLYKGHSGFAGTTGETNEMFDSRLKENIAWICYHKPQTLTEIARLTGVPQVYIADNLAKLVEFGYIDRLDDTKNPKYQTNMVITDERNPPEYEDLLDQAADYLCGHYFTEVFHAFDEDPAHFGLSCEGGDSNFMKYTLVMLGIWHLQTFFGNHAWEKYAVARPDGGKFIAMAGVGDDLTPMREKTDDPYWTVGFMTRNFYAFTPEERKAHPDEAHYMLMVGCRYTDRSSDWRDYRAGDFLSLTSFVHCGKNRITPDEYKRLCDLGYIVHDRLMMVTLTACLSENEALCCAPEKLVREHFPISDGLTAYARELSTSIAERILKHFPEHMHPLIREIYGNEQIGNPSLIPRIIEKMLRSEVLMPITDDQKRAACALFCLPLSC